MSEQKELQQPEIVTVPAKVDFDFDHYKNKLQEYIADYNIVVTEENLADAKKAATDLNKLSAAIKAGFKVNIDQIKEPAVKLSEYSKELDGICQAGRQEILSQVARFEKVKLDKAQELLAAFREELFEVHGVDDRFKRAEFDDLILLGSLTGKEELTKAVRDKLEARVKDDAMVQQRTALRHAELTSKSVNAGLRVPIEPRHVSSFINADNATYEANVNAIIEAEVERQQKSDQLAQEQKLRDEAEQQRKADIEKQRMDREAEIKAQAEARGVDEKQAAEQLANEEESQSEQTQSQREPVTYSDDKKTVVIVAEWHVTVAGHIPAEAVKNKVREKLIQVGYAPDTIKVG